MVERKLARDRARRDFARTPKPPSASKLAASPRLRFIVQKHDARRRHYDFRLELGGVFQSWAATRGPSLDPGEKRLAVSCRRGRGPSARPWPFRGHHSQTADGGSTGAALGSGLVIARGNPRRPWRAGTLKFSLAGERLKGAWALVRMASGRAGGKRTSWLLIKQNDAAAGAAIGTRSWPRIAPSRRVEAWPRSPRGRGKGQPPSWAQPGKEPRPMRCGIRTATRRRCAPVPASDARRRHRVERSPTAPDRRPTAPARPRQLSAAGLS